MKKLLIITSLSLLASTSYASSKKLDCHDHNTNLINWFSCKDSERHGNNRNGNIERNNPNDPSPNNPDKPSRHPHGGDPIAGNDKPPKNNGGSSSDPQTPPDDGGNDNHGGKGKHRNNGFGNGDQDAPGNSLNHNNAENSQHDRGHSHNNK